MLQTLTDHQAQHVSGGGQLTTYDATQTLVFEQQTILAGQTNAGGQLKQNKQGSGWTDVTSTQWALVSDTTDMTLVSRESVAGKGGTTINSTTVYMDTSGNLLGSDPR